MLKQLNPQFSETFSSDIWQTLLSRGKILISCREDEGMKTSFSLFDLDNNEFLWKHISFEESWWITSYAFCGNVIVFQTFNDSQNIELRSLFGFDIFKMEAIWSIEEITPIGLSGNVLKLKMNSDEEVIFQIDINTGDEISGVNSEKASTNMPSELFLPFHYSEENPHFQKVKDFLKSFADVEIVGACNYLEHNEFILISAHQKLEQNLTSTLWLFDSSGELIFEEMLSLSCKGLASDTFYIVNDRLIFVKEKREIKGYLI